jgi:purine-binding chemotaxis protein CheW
MAESAINQATQYLTFRLQKETYAVDVANIREILDYTAITKVPRTPDYLRGVINLRGSVVPVVDMKLKFGLPETVKTVDTCIIVMEVSLDNEAVVLGSLADAVQEVLDLDPEQIEPAPRIGTGLNTDFIKGMGKHNEQFIMILDITKIFSSDTFLAQVDETDGGGMPDALEACG